MTPRTSTLIANRARALRREMTEPEIMLWSRLKGRGCDLARVADGVILQAEALIRRR
jgi:very-short-patch-repair endonuclease